MLLFFIEFAVAAPPIDSGQLIEFNAKLKQLNTETKQESLD